MKYIITGGAGFIGHNVVRQLEELGHECHVIDSLTNYGFVPKPEMEYLIAERQKRFNAIVIILRSKQHLKELVKLMELFIWPVFHVRKLWDKIQSGVEK